MIALPDALTTAEAAAMIGIKPNTLEIWRCKGKGPRFLKASDRKQAPVRYARAEVESWIEQHTFTSTSDYSAKAA